MSRNVHWRHFKPIAAFKKTDPAETTLSRLQKIKKQNLHLEHLVYFFEALGQSFENHKLLTIQKKQHPIYLQNIKKGFCHQNSLLIKQILPDEIDFVFGFFDSWIVDYNDHYYSETVQHSFLKSTLVTDLLFDPTLSVFNISENRERLVQGKNYYGIIIPDAFLEKYSLSAFEKGHANISKLLKTRFLRDKYTTKKLVREIAAMY